MNTPISSQTIGPSWPVVSVLTGRGSPEFQEAPYATWGCPVLNVGASASFLHNSLAL